jgi:glycolate oxidase iron-sulfur subunit
MKLRVEGRVSSGGAFAHHIDRCLGCRACEPACPAGVRFGALLERAREDRLTEAGGSLGTRLLISLLTGRISKLTYVALRTFRRSGLAGVGSHLPGRLGAAFAALTASAPSNRSRRTVADGAAAKPASGSESFALLEGCAMKGLFNHVHDAARRVLRASGYEERSAPNQRCCGALHAHAGLSRSARRLAKRNIEAFERSGARWFVVDSAGCGAALKGYPEWLDGSGQWSARAQRIADATCDVTRLVATATVPPKGELRGRVAYDAPCHLSYGLGDTTSVLEALSCIRGLSVERLPSADRCCGGAGLYALQQPDLSNRILAPKLREIEQGNYDTVACGNPSCIMQIGGGLRRAGLGAGVLHPVELLDRAIGEGADRERL